MEIQELQDFKEVPTELIDPSPYQHRRHFSKDKLQELADSIKRDGLVEPVVVRHQNGNGRYEMIAGERRMRACQLIGIPEILARIVSVTDLQARRMCAAENLQRENLSAIEEVEAVVEMIDAELIEDEEYQGFGDTPTDRVKWVLSRMAALESIKNKGEDETKCTFYNKINKFVNLIVAITKSLPRPINWRSFYNHDLQLITKLDKDVAEVAAVNKLNKTKTKAMQKFKEDAPAQFEQIHAQARQGEAGQIAVGYIDPEQVDLSEVSAREISRAGRRAQSGGIVPHVLHNSGDNEWYTTPEHARAVRLVLGQIDLDPASSPEANKVIQANVFYTAKDNGLAYPWRGRVFMNPPYASSLIGLFASKLKEHVETGDVTEAIALVNNATETKWFNDIISVASAVCFPQGRVKFWAIDKIAAPLQGQTFIYIGDNPNEFKGVFSRFGWVATI
jgi:hypothetical protein